MKHLLLGLVLLCLLVAGTVLVQGKTFQTDSRIAEVSKHRITVHVGRSHHTYKITSQTLIQLDGVKVHAKALKTGMHADVTASQFDRKTAVAVAASSGS